MTAALSTGTRRVRCAPDDHSNRGSKLHNCDLACWAQGLSVGPDKRRVIGAHPSRGTRVPMMQAANLRNRDDLALRRRFHLTWCRRVAIQRQMWPGIVIVGEVYSTRSQSAETCTMALRGRRSGMAVLDGLGGPSYKTSVCDRVQYSLQGCGKDAFRSARSRGPDTPCECSR